MHIGNYRYTPDLLRLGTGKAYGTAGDTRLASLSTPLNLAAWTYKLRKHPDKEFAQYILDGVKHGFSIGVNESATFTSAKKNMLSANQNPRVIDSYLSTEVKSGNILGPFPEQTAPKIHINRFVKF